jgi:PAS domain S-box-containing protein
MEMPLTNHRHTACHRRFLSSLLISGLSFLSFLFFYLPSVNADDRIVTIGVYENAPKVFMSESGNPSGIFIDIIEYIAQIEGWRLKYISGTWADGLDRLKKREIDLMPDVAFTTDRDKIYAFHKVPVLSSWFEVYAPKGSNIQSILDLNETRILVLERSVQEEAFIRLGKGFGINFTLISVPDYKTMFEMIARGEADAAITNRFYGMMHAKKFGLEDTAVVFEPSDLFFAASKKDPKQLLATIDLHLLDLKKDPQSIYYSSLKRWTSEEIQFKLPAWVQPLGVVVGVILIMSLVGGVVLNHQVNARTRALRASEQKYRELVMLANSIILRWSSDGRITFLNEFGQRFFGYTEAEVLGRHVIGTIVPDSESTGRDLSPLMEQICADPQKFERNINENIRRNGERVWVDWTNKVVLDDQGQIKEILSIGSDITDRKHAEEQVRRLNDALRQHADILEERIKERTAELQAVNVEQRTIFDSANVGIVLMRDRMIVNCNRKMDEIFGYGSGELAGKSMRLWYPNEAAYAIGGNLVYSQMSKGEMQRREQQLVRKNGALFWARLSGKAFDKNNANKGAVVIVEDITNEREVAENLKKALEKAQAADRIKSAFLATMSHELRTPLNSIIGFTGIMLQGLAGPLNQEQRKQMSMVQTSSRHLLALINDVLDISKIEAGQLEISISSFELKPSIEKMAKLVSPLAEKKGLDLRLDIADDVETVITDQRRLEQVILNLLNNAVKFTEKGHVLIGCRNETDQYMLSVTDTGIGIRKEEIPKLFQPFHQIDTGLTRKHEGTGLGLSICRKLLDLMGGTISVESLWGQGSTFVIRLPKG